jgi:hypothetical protein
LQTMVAIHPQKCTNQYQNVFLADLHYVNVKLNMPQFGESYPKRLWTALKVTFL